MISKAGMKCSTFQYMGLKPQIRKAEDAYTTPDKDSCCEFTVGCRFIRRE
jgi:hypothetical protein